MGKQEDDSVIYAKVINGIAIAVTVVWSASFLADMMMPEYNPPSQIHTIMLAIVGAIFGFQVTRRNKSNGSNS